MDKKSGVDPRLGVLLCDLLRDVVCEEAVVSLEQNIKSLSAPSILDFFLAIKNFLVY